VLYIDGGLLTAHWASRKVNRILGHHNGPLKITLWTHKLNGVPHKRRIF